MPKISVIVPVYNTEKYLRRCIDSILAQTFTDFELLLVDDGSKDNSGTICDEYAEKDPRVRVFHKENGGVSSARNHGLDKAKGEWVAFFDSDDWVDCKMFSVCSRNFNKSDVVMYDTYFVSDKRSVIVHSQWDHKDKTSNLRQYIKSVWTACWGYLFKKEISDNYKIRFLQDVYLCEDFNFSVKILYYAQEVLHVELPLYYYNRQNVNSILHTQSLNYMQNECEANIDIISFFMKHNCLSQYEREMSHRVLKAKQDMILDIKTLDDFMKIFPVCHKYIISCPYINLKIKLLCFAYTHKMQWLTLACIKSRNLYYNLKNK